MNLNVTIFFAFRYLYEKRKITFSAILGIAIGVAILLSFLCLTNGYRQSLVNRILGVNSHIKVMNIQGAPLFNYKNSIDKINNIEGVTETSPLIVKTGLIKKQNRTLNIQLKGITSSKIIDNIVEGSSKDLHKNKVLLGTKLAENLGSYVGDKVNIILPNGKRNIMEVGGIFDANLNQYNARIVYISFNKAQTVFNMANQASLIQVNTRDPFTAGKIAEKIQEKTNYYAVDWQKANNNLFSAMKVEKRLFAIILAFMLIIAGFGIANILNMLVLEKRKDIGILKAIGTPKKVIRHIFLLQGFIMGAIGISLGIILGLAITYLLSKYPIRIESDVYNVEYLSIQLKWGQFVIVSGLTLLITSIASIYPANKATNLPTIEVLRNE